MKKTVIGMAMMAMALVGFNGFAQNTARSQKAQVEDRYSALNITDAQKAKLAELDARQQAKREAAMEARKADGRKEDFKNMTDEQRKAAMQARKDARKAEKLEYLQEVKEIVGPDQYVVFLEDIYVNGGQQGGRKAFSQGRKDGRKGMAQGKGKSDKAGRKGDRKGGQGKADRKNSAAAQS